MPFFSIIIPVYNASSYLEKILNDIVDQSFKNFEVILVDDGSEDNSKQVCKNIISKDPRFKYVYQHNKGAYSARNKGIENAIGEYIIFADADDGIKSNALKVIYSSIINEQLRPNIVIFGKNEVKNDGRILTSSSVKSNKSGKLDFELLYELFMNNLIATTWNKAIDRNFLNNIRFEHLLIGEDYQFYLDILEKKPTVKLIPEILYDYYIETENSIFKKYDVDRFETLKRQHVQLIKIAKEIGADKTEIKNISNNNCAYCLDRLVINLFRKENKDSAKEKFNKIKQYNSFFNFSLRNINYPFSKQKKTKLFLANKLNVFKMVILILLYKFK
ncbi:glycosyltransferase family 2 protein [Pediococcus pentosaceus]|uniref:glycosyltransferase family 2 protein n=1 Tax=Pediococcus pentosaceus TaxID=1255 RepID=UPI0011B7C0E9|nr:glycosyltransferase family 2 protein [Pediococcus pentosaceus]MEB3376385.1 glycosyltransferase family 2 protein [Pediococcus pentosaceus]QDZ69680.1 glycosyltransferase family 2 protein [Pediococcus pentosaceus]